MAAEIIVINCYSNSSNSSKSGNSISENSTPTSRSRSSKSNISSTIGVSQREKSHERKMT